MPVNNLNDTSEQLSKIKTATEEVERQLLGEDSTMADILDKHQKQFDLTKKLLNLSKQVNVSKDIQKSIEGDLTSESSVQNLMLKLNKAALSEIQKYESRSKELHTELKNIRNKELMGYDNQLKAESAIQFLEKKRDGIQKSLTKEATKNKEALKGSLEYTKKQIELAKKDLENQITGGKIASRTRNEIRDKYKIARQQEEIGRIQTEKGLKDQLILLTEQLKVIKQKKYEESVIDNLLSKHAQSLGAISEMTSFITGKYIDIGAIIKDKMTGGSATWLILLMKAVDRFVELDQAAEDFRRTTGLTREQTFDIYQLATKLSREYQGMGIGVKEVYNAAKALSLTFQDNVLAIRQNTEFVALMSANLGVAEADSAKMLQTFMGLSKLTNEQAQNLSANVISLSKAANIAPSKVMHDIAVASSDTLKFMRGSVVELIKASVAARRMGQELKDISSTAERLIDFQSSVAAEMTASVLLGKAMNVQRLRELAYAGDFEGMMQEQLRLLNEVGGLRGKDAFQTKAIADALGTSVEQLTKMSAQQDLLNAARREDPSFFRKYELELQKLNQMKDATKLTGVEAKKRVELELKQQQMQAKTTILVNRLKELWVNIADILTPIVDIAAQLLMIVGKMTSWLASGVSKFVGLYQGIGEWFEQMWGTTGKTISAIGGVSAAFIGAAIGGKSLIRVLGSLLGIFSPLTRLAGGVIGALTTGLATALGGMAAVLTPLQPLIWPMVAAFAAFGGVLWVVSKAAQNFGSAISGTLDSVAKLKDIGLKAIVSDMSILSSSVKFLADRSISASIDILTNSLKLLTNALYNVDASRLQRILDIRSDTNAGGVSVNNLPQANITDVLSLDRTKGGKTAITTPPEISITDLVDAIKSVKSEVGGLRDDLNAGKVGVYIDSQLMNVTMRRNTRYKEGWPTTKEVVGD